MFITHLIANLRWFELIVEIIINLRALEDNRIHDCRKEGLLGNLAGIGRLINENFEFKFQTNFKWMEIEFHF